MIAQNKTEQSTVTFRRASSSAKASAASRDTVKNYTREVLGGPVACFLSSSALSRSTLSVAQPLERTPSRAVRGVLMAAEDASLHNMLSSPNFERFAGICRRALVYKQLAAYP